MDTSRYGAHATNPADKLEHAKLRLDPAFEFRQSPTHVAIQRGRSPVRVIVGIILVLSLLSISLSSSPLTAAAAGLSLAATVLMLWRPNDIPILLLPIGYQWLQVAVKPILAVIYDKPIDNVLNGIGFQVESGTEAAALFGFAGVFCLCLGIRLGSRGVRVDAARALPIETRIWDKGILLRLSFSAIVIGRVAVMFASAAGAAYQLFLAFAGLEYVGLFALAYWCFINATGYRYLIAVMTFEILIGFTGYFADFQTPIIVLAIAALATRPSLRPLSIVIMTCLVAAVLCLATFWSEIKYDYRNFANGGSGAQTVSQPLDARLSYIYDAASRFDASQFADGFNRLLARFSYIDFLGATLNYVPSMVPHEDGKLIGMAVANMLMPRILFPDKQSLRSDTEVTSEYTGLIFYSGAEQTSISIGYLGELYIDFGYIGALIATIIIGAIFGFGYRLLRDYDRTPLLVNYGICTMLGLSFTDFGTALVKTLNGAVLAFAAAMIIQRFIVPRALALYFPQYKRQPVRVNQLNRR
jgi:hypothetical protein